MKKIWICRWEVVPGNGEQTEQFSSLPAAKLAMRKKIVEHIDLKDYLVDLDPSAAEFLARYLSDPHFPKSKSDIPEDYEEPEHVDLFLGADFLLWNHRRNAYPKMSGNLVLEDALDEDYAFDFWYEHRKEAPANVATGLSIRIYSYIDYGSSAYPLMVLFALRETPQTQEQLVHTIYDFWDTHVDRKAVGRHLQLLQNLGFPVQKCKDGYYRGGESHEPKAGIQYSSSAYPLMILQVLDETPKTQTAIIQAVQGKYDTKLDRKAVSRHLNLLDALGCRIEKGKNGYSLKNKRTIIY